MWKVKRMNTARIVVLTIAVCAGGAAAYLASGSNPKPVETAAVTMDTTDVLVARSDIALGQTVTPDDIQWQSWPSSTASSSFIRKTDRAEALDDLRRRTLALGNARPEVLANTFRFRDWIEKRRAAAGRMPRRYPTIEAAFTRMKEENGFLTDEQARHLTIHGASRNEDGTWSWKFDPYLNNWPFEDTPEDRLEELWSAITCPILFLYGADSWASNPEKDGRAMVFQDWRVSEFENAGHWLHHDQFDRFMAEVRAFL